MGLFPGETGEARNVPNVRNTAAFVVSNIRWAAYGVTPGTVDVERYFGCRLAVCLVATGLPNAHMAMRILCISWRWW